MRTKNICRFIPASAVGERLETVYFIYESDPGVMSREAELPHHRAVLAVQGSGSIFFDGEGFPLSAGSLYFGFAGERFSVQAAEPAEYMYISFGGLRAEGLFSRFDIRRDFRVRGGMEGLIPFWRDSLSRVEDENVDLAAESVLLYTFARLRTAAPVSEDAVSRATQLLEESFSDPELSLSSVAAELGYNAKYLSHAFREKRGVGFSEYLKNLRIKHAVFLFDHGIDSVKNVAFLAGFRDPLYFSAVFKKTVGISPKEYRERRKVQIQRQL